MADSAILQGCFQLYPKKTFYEVRLTRLQLIYEETTFSGCCQSARPQVIVNLRDIYGAKLFKCCQTNDDSAYIHIFTCPLRENERNREKLCFKVNGWEDMDANIKLAEKWTRTILWLVNDSSLDLSALQEKRNLPPCRKLLVLVNPYSGKGKSLKIFRKKVAPMFDEADIEYKLSITEYAGHAKVIGSQLDVRHWDGLVICSGDGLVHEVINGLMSRPDWEAAIKMPLGVIPTGSGNALCFSGLFASGEPMQLTSAIYAVIRGNIHELDIASLITPTEKCFSFLSMTWGIMSDVDIESEKYRYLGNARFTVGALVRILHLRTYKGRISYLPMESEPSEGFTSSIDVPIMKSVGADELPFQTPKDEFHSPTGSFYSMPGSPTEERLGQDMMTSCDNAGMIDSERPSINNLSGAGIINVLPGNGVIKGAYTQDPGLPDSHLLGPTPDLLPGFSDSLPPSWKTVDGEFILGSMVLVTHLGPELCCAPQSRFGDGAMFVCYLKPGLSKMQLINLFLKMEDGTHLEAEEIVCVKARAFRLEPDLNQSGTVAIDGELIPYSSIQGQVHKSLGKLMCV